MNRLSLELSPYLLQHAGNPVDWYPWGEEALERARREERPILLSIGYSACHWCHVMEHESFEDPETARLMNELFVNIKVDREERPDLDAIYMSATQAMTGHGGWPMTVFLTPQGVPFYAGTYFPPEDRHGMPSFRRVLLSVAAAWRDRRTEVERTAASVREMYDAIAGEMASAGPLAPAILDRAYRGIAQRYDVRNGGFEGAPKFPQAMALDFLLRYWRRTGTSGALEMAATSFRRMARGGIYDQVGGGFHRYSVDAVWLVPHFEKMLYDNALLARLGVHLWQATGDAEPRRVVEETLAWVRREMTAPSGGFYSTLDADSEGEEGKFYLWTEDEIHDVLDAGMADLVIAYYGVTKMGNFEGRNILHVPNDPHVVAARHGEEVAALEAGIAHARQRLYEARTRRVWPARDEKIIASWNGLMLRAVAEAARVFGHVEYREMALRNGEFLFREMVRDGRVYRAHKDGVTRIPGFLEDYAAVGLGALALYELTFRREWLERAVTLARSMVEWFWDVGARAFFDTARDAEVLVARPREVTDNATPSGTSLAVELLLRLAELTGEEEARRRATRVLETLGEAMARHGAAFGHLLGAADLAINGAVEVALVGAPERLDFVSLRDEIARHYLPALALAGGLPEEAAGVALLDGRPMRDGRATAYVCRQYACEAPTTDPATLGEQVERAAAWKAGTL
ncbi:MAG TPA: thioredoxin domain-containing protein [Gemmatimonadaceae bacterium]|nr:thioredoxin domain-containing protein [Gemmatimonadaceae bacterium]